MSGPSLRGICHDALRDCLHRAAGQAFPAPGPLCVVDGTAGNGQDTLFLAQCLARYEGPEGPEGPEGFGARGLVWAFDVQKDALTRTARRLEEARLSHCVRLVHDGHENMDAHLPPGQAVHAACFNLGYLPGGDKSLVTRGSTSLAAAQAVLLRLAPGGLLSLHIYTGHEGGAEEADALLGWAQALPHATRPVLHIFTQNKPSHIEHLLLISAAKS